ncbi:4Fe-4S dicluster domain-containing protein [Prodigiosinella aquatilis]|nr:4Fe-4S dicluster domain-containing protein [Prodigiosinella sp. LS101]WJV55922.1 4Fe-4S dicluster domain-containing protein [Prodigiosinella sp. LS101]WJV60285.1 4Fe-4S dicluster domain-containing protein [Pectobacteriaceae bacterium C111]
MNESIDVKLTINKFYIDENHPHIIIRESPDMATFSLLMKACPAGLYKQLEDGTIRFDYVGCLECGACRIIGGNSVLAKWVYPQEASGVHYRFG